jgi:MFS family permease
VIASALIWWKLPESNPCVINSNLTPKSLRRVFGQEQKSCYQVEDAEKLSTARILKLPFVLPLLVIYFLVMLGFNFFYVVFPVFVVRQLDWDVTGTGIFFAVLSALMVLVQGPVLKRLARHFSEARLIVSGGLVLATSFLFFLSHQLPFIYVGAALMALGNGLMWPSLVSVLSEAAGSRYQGAVQGLAGSIGAIASILGLLAGGLLYGLLQEWVFVITAACILVSVTVAVIMKYPRAAK